jgi:Uncharacterised nucleotidyltransferase
VTEDRSFDGLLSAMKRAAATLRDEGIEFALAGGLAIYARGGPERGHDVDFVLRREDVPQAIAALRQAGFRSEQPPEDWLVKVFDENGAMIDLIFAPNYDEEAVDGMLVRAEMLEVYAVEMRVMSATDVLATKLLALKEHELDYEDVLEIARACREQVDWDVLAARTDGHPYAAAFLTLAHELGLDTVSEDLTRP